MVDISRKDPSQYTRAELEQMLRVERLGVTQQFLALEREIRERAERLEELERRLRAHRHRLASTSNSGWADA